MCDPSQRGRLRRIARRLEDAGYDVEVEEFPSRGPMEPRLASYAGISAVAALLVYPAPLLAAVLGIAALVLHARESDGRPLLRRASSRGVNVVARAPGAAAPGLVVFASATARPRRARSVELSLHTLMVAAPAAAAAAWIAEAETELPLSVGVGGVFVAVLVVALALISYRPLADPAPEGDAAVEAVVGVAPLLRARPAWLVVAGSSDGIAEGLLELHSEKVAGAVWLNLLPSSSGEVVAVSEEGAWRERRADRWLLDAAEEAGAVGRPHRAHTAVTPLLARRRRALTLMVPEGAVPVAAATARAAFDDRST